MSTRLIHVTPQDVVTFHEVETSVTVVSADPSADPMDVIDVEVRVTHPDLLLSTPRVASLATTSAADSSSSTTSFLLTLAEADQPAALLVALQQLQSQNSSTPPTPVRVMLVATRRSTKETQKVKLVCDMDPLLRTLQQSTRTAPQQREEGELQGRPTEDGRRRVATPSSTSDVAATTEATSPLVVSIHSLGQQDEGSSSSDVPFAQQGKCYSCQWQYKIPGGGGGGEAVGGSSSSPSESGSTAWKVARDRKGVVLEDGEEEPPLTANSSASSFVIRPPSSSNHTGTATAVDLGKILLAIVEGSEGSQSGDYVHEGLRAKAKILATDVWAAAERQFRSLAASKKSTTTTAVFLQFPVTPAVSHQSANPNWFVTLKARRQSRLPSAPAALQQGAALTPPPSPAVLPQSQQARTPPPPHSVSKPSTPALAPTAVIGGRTSATIATTGSTTPLKVSKQEAFAMLDDDDEREPTDKKPSAVDPTSDDPLASTSTGSTADRLKETMHRLDSLRTLNQSLKANQMTNPLAALSALSEQYSHEKSNPFRGLDMHGANDATLDSSLLAATTPAAPPKSSNVFVAVRVRPHLRDEATTAWRIEQNTVCSNSNERGYVFDEVFSPTTSTRAVFDKLCPPMVRHALEGINGTLFTYGQTASGKTHTVFGSDNEAGLTPLIIGDLFEQIPSAPYKVREVHASYFEIYNEELNDLLEPSRRNLVIRSSPSGNFVVDVTKIAVGSADEALQVLFHGSLNKKMGQSQLNDRSSRSHTIFRLSFTMQDKQQPEVLIASELCLVDLAGSEALSEKSLRKETTNINLSLSYLKKVIGELASKERFVSYRNSALTKVLKQAIGGNSKTVLICCIGPAEEHARDSRNTLMFGTTAKTIVTTARVNRSGGGGMGEDRLRKELIRMQQQLVAYEETVAAYATVDEDFRKLLEENERLVAENEALRRQVGEGGTTGSPMARRPTHHSDPNTAPGGAEGGRGASTSQIREEAAIHRSVLTEAISRLENAVGNSDDGDDDGSIAAVAKRREEEEDDEDMEGYEDFDDADAASRRPNRLPAVKRPPPSAQQRSSILTSSTTTTTTTGALSNEQLHLRLIQVQADHHRELFQKEEEFRRLLADRPRPSDEIQEVNRKEQKVVTLLDQLHTFLHHGTAVNTVSGMDLTTVSYGTKVKSATSSSTVHIGRYFMYLYTPSVNNGSTDAPSLPAQQQHAPTSLCFCLVDPTNPKAPKRSSCFESIPIAEIAKVELGQFSPGFSAFLQAAAQPRWTISTSGASDPNVAKKTATVNNSFSAAFKDFFSPSKAHRSTIVNAGGNKTLVSAPTSSQFMIYALPPVTAASPESAEELEANSTGGASNEGAITARQQECIVSLRNRNRMSFTILTKKGKQFDIVCEDEADFEAWVIELNRLVGTSAEWTCPLDISGYENAEMLTAEEQHFCGSMHIHPNEYLVAKNKMVKRRDRFVTLFDVRSLAQFDLYHSQRFFYFLRCQKWVAQSSVFYMTDDFANSVKVNLDEL